MTQLAETRPGRWEPQGLVPRRFDAVTVLSVYLFMLVALPSTLRIAPLRNLGLPVVLFGLAMATLWCAWQLQRAQPSGTGSQPIRLAFLAVTTCFGLSFVVAMVRPIDTHETNAAVLAMIGLLSWGGSLLVANDGIASLDRHRVMVRRLVFAGGCLALVGLFQFVTGQRWVDLITVPGLTNTQPVSVVGMRDGFNRPAGTALHPIEFGYVIAIILPIAINLAIVDRARSTVRRALPVLLMSTTVVVSISRSTIICAVVGVLIASTAWPRELRRTALLLSPLALMGVFVAIPGLLGTVLGLFLGIPDDTSAQSRTNSYDIAMEFFARSPVLGRGFGTFLPSYRILDNGYLLLLTEVGLLGLASVLVLITSGVWCSARIGQSADAEDRLMGRALLAAIVAAAVGLALFDGLSFPMAAGVLFLVLGLTGARWRLVRADTPEDGGVRVR